MLSCGFHKHLCSHQHLDILLLFISGLIRGKHHFPNMKEKERLDLFNTIGIQVNWKKTIECIRGG